MISRVLDTIGLVLFALFIFNTAWMLLMFDIGGCAPNGHAQIECNGEVFLLRALETIVVMVSAWGLFIVVSLPAEIIKFESISPIILWIAELFIMFCMLRSVLPRLNSLMGLNNKVDDKRMDA